MTVCLSAEPAVSVWMLVIICSAAVIIIILLILIIMLCRRRQVQLNPFFVQSQKNIVAAQFNSVFVSFSAADISGG